MQTLNTEGNSHLSFSWLVLTTADCSFQFRISLNLFCKKDNHAVIEYCDSRMQIVCEEKCRNRTELCPTLCETWTLALLTSVAIAASAPVEITIRASLTSQVRFSSIKTQTPGFHSWFRQCGLQSSRIACTRPCLTDLKDIVLSWFSLYLVEGLNMLSLKVWCPAPSACFPMFPIHQHVNHFHCYAEGTQLYFKTNLRLSAPWHSTLSTCLEQIGVWMKLNFLQLKCSKNEAILLGNSQQFS